MAALAVRNVDEEVVRRLRIRAVEHGRSRARCVRFPI